MTINFYSYSLSVENNDLVIRQAVPDMPIQEITLSMNQIKLFCESVEIMSQLHTPVKTENGNVKTA